MPGFVYIRIPTPHAMVDMPEKTLTLFKDQRNSGPYLVPILLTAFLQTTSHILAKISAHSLTKTVAKFSTVLDGDSLEKVALGDRHILKNFHTQSG